MSSNCNWRSVDDEILIKFVRNHEAIYNIKSKEYRKTQLKQNLWREIGEILNKTDSDCAKRWCYVRDYYIRRKAKPGTGSSGEAAKKRSDLLSFLDRLPSSQRSNTSVNENREDNSVTENINDKQIHGKQAQSPEGNIKIENTYHESEEETESNNQEIELTICDSNDDKNGNATSKNMRHNAHDVQERLNLHTQIDQNPTDGLDETDLFFSSMAKIVKKLSRYEQAKLRMQIGSLVGNAELRHISNNSPQTSELSPTLWR
ncbi:uncharacterized protein [Choristoneura fumiferana]|uniref:uncharacterized protein n=1 Tax=Choristoneura fumiferana TaxID=7141 RepID=UPI003D157065